ncbi:unnamed protein product, partial [marine sediment metagenome]
SELALKMLEWEKQKRELDGLGNEICSVVLDIGKTQTVGNVRATFNNGRKEYDYESPGINAPQEIINKHSHSELEIDWMEVAKEAGYTTEQREKHTKSIIFTKWANVCKEGKIDPVVLSQGEPSVKLKLMELISKE